MHFWIDKRSQTYGFGRARVAASLSGAGGNGLGFPHPPRRIGGKTSLMPTIHRLPPPQHQQQQQQHSHGHGHQQQQQQSTTIDCHRSHSISNNNNNNINNAHNSNHSHSNNNHHSNSNFSSGGNTIPANNNNNNFNNSSGSGTITHYSSNRTNRGCRSGGSVNSATLNNNNHQHETTATLTTTTTRSYHHHPQFGNMSIRHYQPQQPSTTTAVDHSPYGTRVHHHHHHHSSTQRTHSSASSPATTVTSLSLPPIYVSPSHAQNLEQGAMGLGPIPTVRLHQSNTSGTVTTTTTGSNPIIDSADSQVLPSHLKYGMWATLILASVFVAGAKFYADHQGTGLEVLIFAAFSATFFLAACTVSLCRLPNSLATSPSLSIDDSSRGLLSQQHNQLSIHYQPAQQQPQENLELTPTGAPPPYHIAILLPENGKEPHFKDESPPPSYDKIVI